MILQKIKEINSCTTTIRALFDKLEVVSETLFVSSKRYFNYDEKFLKKCGYKDLKGVDTVIINNRTIFFIEFKGGNPDNLKGRLEKCKIQNKFLETLILCKQLFGKQDNMKITLLLITQEQREENANNNAMKKLNSKLRGIASIGCKNYAIQFGLEKLRYFVDEIYTLPRDNFLKCVERGDFKFAQDWR